MRRRISGLLAIIVFTTPLFAIAAGSGLHYAGWIPFWKKQSGALDIALNLYKLHEVSPFSYEVGSGGALKDVLKIHEGLWPGWLAAVRDARIKIIPTIAWFNGDGIHNLLSKTKPRQAHEDLIAKLVKDERFDGIDIDYESKKAETNPYFSLFIKGLALRLHPRNKILSCTIESRTPASSLRQNIKREPGYANDYPTLNKYCDEVRIMAYDQGVIDAKLDATKGNGNFYAPVADPDWAEKVVKEAVKTISRKKIMLGVPTYGYEYQVSWDGGLTTYRRLRSVNFFTAMNLADALNISPSRTSAGELGFTYTTSTFREVSAALRFDVSSTLPVGLPSSTANSTTSVARFVSFSDAESANQKIQLAKKYGLRGVAFFKLDGEFDPLLWEKMK